MVAKTPVKVRRMAAALNPNLVRETVKKVDRCMARLQELQYTVTGGTKVVSGVSLSPRSTRGYLRTSVRCKQESLRLKNAPAWKSPTGKKYQGSTNGEWRRTSLPAMLLGETVVEILQASQFAKEVVTAATKLSSTTAADPKTPVTIRRNKKPQCENTGLRTRRKKEKQNLLRTVRSESDSPELTRARSRIRFKSNSPLSRKRHEIIGGRPSVAARRVSPKNRPWAKKTVLFPNPLFLPSSSSPSSAQKQRQRFYKTRSPIIGRTTRPQTPHKFVIKSPPKSLKSQFKHSKAVPETARKSPPVEKVVAVPKTRRRCSFSPSMLANRLVSPLKNRISLPLLASPLKTRNPLRKSGGGLMSGLKQRPSFTTPVKVSSSRRLN